jgi:transcriptional regulator with XRE-family HTH domain
VSTHPTFGQLLAEARYDKGWTQWDLSRRTGFQPAAISHWECDRRTPHVANLIVLCRVLEVSADWLMGLPIVDEL